MWRWGKAHRGHTAPCAGTAKAGAGSGDDKEGCRSQAGLTGEEKSAGFAINQSINQSYLTASPEIRGYFEVTLLKSERPGLVEVTLLMAEGGMR